MIQRAIRRAGTGTQTAFQDTLCSKLLSSGLEKQLLELRELFVDDFLRANGHVDLLYRWYKLHELHERAGQIMYEQALAERPRRIAERISDLSYAVSSAEDVSRSLSQAGAVYTNTKVAHFFLLAVLTP